MNPYIGVTGFMNKDEVLAVLNMLPQDLKRKVMIGVLASSKTIQGFSNKWPSRYPKPENLGDIFQPHPEALNLIHFNTDDPEFLFEQTEKARALAGKHCHGFQLNIAWPNPVTLQKIASVKENEVIVLQIRKRAFEMMKDSPQRLADFVASEYATLVDYILLDASGGYGKELNTEALKEYLRALTEKHLEIGIGVAGGLSPSTLHLMNPLIEEFPDLSIDAEGKLRDTNDNLNVGVATSYLLDAIALFEKK